MSIDYLLIGHITADLTPNGRTLGGTVSYALRTAAAFGRRVGVLTSAAPGEPLLVEVMRYAADMIALPADATTTYENIYQSSGRVQYIRGAAAPIAARDVPTAWRAAPLVFLAPIAGEIDREVPGLFPDAIVMLTLQGWLRAWGGDGRVRFKPWFDADVLRTVDIVVFSEEDIVEAPEMEAQIAANARHVFVTRAEKGGTYYRDGVPHDYPTPQVELVNPTGAGDVFAASLLACLPAFDNDFARAIAVAAQCGAIAVTRPFLEGAPTPEEARRLLNRVLRTEESLF